MEKLIIGITGTNGAGKGTFVDYLVERGFTHFSMSEFIVEEIERRGLPTNRDTMREIGNRIRAEHCPDHIAAQLYDRARKHDGPVVIESLRTEAEVRYLQGQTNFHLIGVDAKPEVRYGRITKRGSEKDKVTYEQFVAQEEAERTSSDPTKQNLSRCMEMADFVIVNDGTLDDLRNNVDKLLNEIESTN